MSATETTYNGWKNYPTWAVNLWLSNDEGLYEMTRELVADASRLLDEGEKPETWIVADAIKDLVEELPEVTAVTENASFVSDLLGYALGDVDWFEIAEAWLSES